MIGVDLMTSRYEAMVSTEKMQVEAVVIAAQTLIGGAAESQLTKQLVQPSEIVMVEVGITYRDVETGFYMKLGGCVANDVYAEALAAIIARSTPPSGAEA